MEFNSFHARHPTSPDRLPLMTDASVYRIPVPNPFVEGRTCVYVIAADPVTLIDSGVATDRAWQVLVDGLKEHGLQASDIKRVILTHKHIDHLGNAWRFQRQSGAEIMIHESEQAAVSDVDPSGRNFAAAVNERLDEWHVPVEVRSTEVMNLRPEWTIESASTTPLIDGQRIPHGDGHIEVIHTPGHTMGSICLRFGRSLFSGDTLLPDISPNVGGGDVRHRNLLRHYLASLARIRNLSAGADLQVMPGHGDPMPTFADRCDELIRHHHRRLDQIVAILDRRGSLTVHELARALFGKMEGFHVVLGCAEAFAHLELLLEQGRVSQTDGMYSRE